MTTKYVCLPEYACICYPPGKSVSRNTMLNHRLVANNRRIEQGLEGNIPWGPQDSESSTVRLRYDNIAEKAQEVDETLSSQEDRLQFSDENQIAMSLDGSLGLPSPEESVISDGMCDSSPVCQQLNETTGEASGTLDHSRPDEGNNCNEDDGLVQNPPYQHSSVFEIEHTTVETGTLYHAEDVDVDNNYEVIEDNGPLSDASGEASLESDVDGEVESAYAIADAHLTDGNFPDNDTSDEEPDLSERATASRHTTPFGIWASKYRGWIDLFYKHGLPQIVMDDALPLIEPPYKTWKTITARLGIESGMAKGVAVYPICPGHMCFFAEDVLNCTVCGFERPDVEMKIAPKMEWMTLVPRLQDWFLDKERCDQLYNYMSSTETSDGTCVRDFFDTNAFQRISECYGGEELVQDDIFLGISTDGFQAFKNKCYDVWPIAAILLNLPPHVRFCVKNVIPFSFIPGPSEPNNLQSFFGPLISEIEEINGDGGMYFDFYDAEKRRVRFHVLWFTGDLPAVKKVGGLKGHNGKHPCIFCWIEGIWCVAHRHSYYPLMVKEFDGNASLRYESEMHPLRTEEESIDLISELSSLSGQGKAELQISSGIVEDSNLFRLPNLVPYKSFPIDVMHLFYNIAKDMLRLWCGDGGEPYSLGRNAMRAIDAELLSFGDGIASCMAARPRAISKWKDWKSAEIKAIILNYSLFVLDGYLPEPYLTGWKSFVEMVDICWRAVLTTADIEEVGRLAWNFYRHFEKYYYKYEEGKMNLCKYVFHLILHLEEGIRECGPPL